MKTFIKIGGLLLLSAIDATMALGQFVIFPTSGTITYEKSINSYSLIKEMLGTTPLALDAQRFEQYKQTQRQFKRSQAILNFNDQQTLYQPVPDKISQSSYFVIPMADQKNIVYINLKAKTAIVQKEVFEAEYLVRDTIQHILWKLTDEPREIAGYKCRRANGLILDSLYVVAFYTDDIHVSGGPESFGGLPGMILMVALPHLHTIWTAKEVNVSVSSAPIIQPPQKGKQISNGELVTLIRDILKKRYTETEYIMQLISFIL